MSDIFTMSANASISELSAGYYYNAWTIGNVDIATGDNTSSNATKRVNTDYIFIKKGTLITFVEQTSKAGFYVLVYTLSKSFVLARGYFREYRAAEDCYVRLVSKYLDDRVITDATDFYNMCRIEPKFGGIPIVKPYISGEFTKLYRTDNYTGSTGATLVATTITDVYAAWDALMAAHTGSITRTLLGNGGNASNVADATLPIYQYTISASNNDKFYSNRLYPAPTVLLMTGLHGDEKSPVWSALDFFTQMYAKLATDETLAAIKSSVTFKVIPVANPGGYNANTRRNLHNVNINRNFSFLFSATTDGDKGAAAYSELEAQIVRDWLVANKTASLFIDFHNNVKDGEIISYVNTPNLEIQRAYASVIRRLSDVWKRGGVTFTADKAYGYVENNQWPTSYNEAFYVDGIYYSAILEIVRTYGAEYSAEVLQMGTETLANYLYAMLDFISR